MIDKNLDFKTTIHHDARIEGYLIDAENRTGKFRSEIGRNCIIWKIRETQHQRGNSLFAK